MKTTNAICMLLLILTEITVLAGCSADSGEPASESCLSSDDTDTDQVSNQKPIVYMTTEINPEGLAHRLTNHYYSV